MAWRLDGLGRSITHLIETVSGLATRGVGFKSLTENIDTTTSGGKLVFHIFGALAEFERDIIRERTTAGLQAARARGRWGDGQRHSPPKRQRCSKRFTRTKPIRLRIFAKRSGSGGRDLPIYQGAQKRCPKRGIRTIRHFR